MALFHNISPDKFIQNPFSLKITVTLIPWADKSTMNISNFPWRSQLVINNLIIIKLLITYSSPLGNLNKALPAAPLPWIRLNYPVMGLISFLPWHLGSQCIESLALVFLHMDLSENLPVSMIPRDVHFGLKKIKINVSECCN